MPRPFGRESLAARRERVARIADVLRQTYPDAHCELNFSNPLELLVATILSAQCSDRQVNLVTPALFAKYRSAGDYASVPLEELEQDIRRIGLYRSKARNIQAACRRIVEEHGGEVPRTMEKLVGLEGVGRKTANVVLSNAFDIHVGVVVDTHVARLSRRLGLTRDEDPVRIENALMKLVSPDDWSLWSHLLIWHGRRRCFARRPDCAGCEVGTLCPSRFRVR